MCRVLPACSQEVSSPRIFFRFDFTIFTRACICCTDVFRHPDNNATRYRAVLDRSVGGRIHKTIFYRPIVCIAAAARFAAAFRAIDHRDVARTRFSRVSTIRKKENNYAASTHRRARVHSTFLLSKKFEIYWNSCPVRFFFSRLVGFFFCRYAYVKSQAWCLSLGKGWRPIDATGSRNSLKSINLRCEEQRKHRFFNCLSHSNIRFYLLNRINKKNLNFDMKHTDSQYTLCFSISVRWRI